MSGEQWTTVQEGAGERGRSRDAPSPAPGRSSLALLSGMILLDTSVLRDFKGIPELRVLLPPVFIAGGDVQCAVGGPASENL